MEDVTQIGKPKPKKRKWSDIIIFSIFAFLIGMTIMLVVASMVVPKIIDKTVDTYTDSTPMVMPMLEHDEALQEEVEERLDTFVEALTRDESDNATQEPVDELMLNEAELNALLHGDENLRDTVRLSFNDGRLRTQLSIPLESDVALGPWRASMRGRYINGIAEMEVGLGETGLAMELVSFEVSGKQVPDWLLRKLQEEIQGEDFWASEDVQEVVGQLGGVEILGDLLILSPKG